MEVHHQPGTLPAHADLASILNKTTGMGIDVSIRQVDPYGDIMWWPNSKRASQHTSTTTRIRRKRKADLHGNQIVGKLFTRSLVQQYENWSNAILKNIELR